MSTEQNYDSLDGIIDDEDFWADVEKRATEAAQAERAKHVTDRSWESWKTEKVVDESGRNSYVSVVEKGDKLVGVYLGDENFHTPSMKDAGFPPRRTLIIRERISGDTYGWDCAREPAKKALAAAEERIGRAIAAGDAIVIIAGDRKRYERGPAAGKMAQYWDISIIPAGAKMMGDSSTPAARQAPPVPTPPAQAPSARGASQPAQQAGLAAQGPSDEISPAAKAGLAKTLLAAASSTDAATLKIVMADASSAGLSPGKLQDPAELALWEESDFGLYLELMGPPPSAIDVSSLSESVRSSLLERFGVTECTTLAHYDEIIAVQAMDEMKQASEPASVTEELAGVSNPFASLG